MESPTLAPPASGVRSRRIPRLGVHAATGQARVVIEERSIYPGRAGPEANEKYRQLIATWRASGELPPVRAAVAAAAAVRPRTLTVGEVAARFLERHHAYCRHGDGSETGELSNFAEAFKPLLARCADLPTQLLA